MATWQYAVLALLGGTALLIWLVLGIKAFRTRRRLHDLNREHFRRRPGE